MKLVFAALLTVLLAIPAGRTLQLCKHESGPVHIFAGNFCDGESGHGRSETTRKPQPSHDHHHDHGHDHSDTHSEHQLPGEHHEPCSHEFFSIGGDLASTCVKAHVSLNVLVALLPIDDFFPAIRSTPPSRYLAKRDTRGPPGLDDPLRQFAAYIRLTV